MSQVKATDAQRKPVEILNHGEPVAVVISSAVLISSHEYARLKAQDRQVVLAGDLDEETVRQLQAAEPPAEAGDFDHEVD